jgi:cell division protein ZapA (FtsZ GTPase activity inhibitor)
MVPVTIGGRIYRLRGENAEALKQLAAEVDRALAAVSGAGGVRDEFKVSVIAALNLVADHQDQRSAWHRQAVTIKERAEALEARLLQLAAGLEPVDERVR